MTFWPAWIVALALAALAVGYWVVLRRPLGVSGVLARFARLGEELERDRAAAALREERAALAAARAAARARAPGAPPGPDDEETITAEWPLLPPDLAATAAGRTCAPTPPVSIHATFLVSVAAGGLVASLARGSFGAGLWSPHGGDVVGARSVLALCAGGVLVGFGAALCGGCTAGHGLTGSGRLMPGSLLATAMLLGAAMVTALLLRSVA